MKPRTVYPSPPEAISGGAAYWTGNMVEVREKDGLITVHSTALDASFTVTREENFRLVGALVSALAWAEGREQT